MSEKPFDTANISDFGVTMSSGSGRWAMVRVRFGIESFGVNAYVAEAAGDELVNEHDELGARSGKHEELYFVGRGHATFMVNGEEIDAPSGTFVHVRDPAAKRGAVAKEPETTIMVVGGKPGEAFTPSEWERSAPGLAHLGAGEYDKAAELLAAALIDHAEDAGLLYNLACAESLGGKPSEALEHLQRALELEPSFRELATKDADLDAIRDDPAFASAVAGETDAGGAGA